MLPWFQNFLSSSNFQNTVSNSARMPHLASFISKCSQLSQLHKKYNLIASECTIYWPCFQHFLIIFNLQKHRSKCARMHLLVSKLSQQCQLWFICQGLIGNEPTYCYLRTHIIFFISYSIYSRSYWPDCHTKRMFAL